MLSTASDRAARVIALLLLVVSVWTSAHRQQDDDACLPLVAGEHDASKHALAPTDAAGAEHCAVCHWMRALKPAFASARIESAILTPSDRPAPAAPVTPLSVASGRLPARAPPVSFL